MIDQTTKTKFLCVEDEIDIRDNIAEILRDEGFEVVEASNGKEGFEVFLKEIPDIIISDIMMPEADGYKLLEMIRNSNRRNKNLPFIFLSALTQKDDILKGIDMSANDYLPKPIDLDLMIAKVKEKAANSIKIKELHEAGINNIKTQISTSLSTRISGYLDIVTRILSNLKSEPYGPYPHRNYSRDINTAYINAVNLKTAIANALDESIISGFAENEEVFSLLAFVKDFIVQSEGQMHGKLYLSSHQTLDTPFSVKVDKTVISEAIKKVIEAAIKTDASVSLEFSVMADHINQLVLIIYFRSQNETFDITANLNEEEVALILAKQGCSHKIISSSQKGLIIIVPTSRVVN